MEDFLRETARLRLRSWRASDLQPFCDMNSDPVVMQHFPKVSSFEESEAMMGRCLDHWREHGFGIAVVEKKDGGSFAGTVGLMHPRFEASFTPCVEIGWRFVQTEWNKGLATEAAKEILRFGFESLQLSQIVSMTSLDNLPSIRVMEKIGMKRSFEFDHPLLPDHRLTRHILYTVDS